MMIVRKIKHMKYNRNCLSFNPSSPLPLTGYMFIHEENLPCDNNRYTSVLWIQIRIQIHMDPYHLAGSGSVSNNTDPDPGSAKN